MCVNGGLFCVSPVMDCPPRFRVYPALCPKLAGIGFSFLVTINRKALQKMTNWLTLERHTYIADFLLKGFPKTAVKLTFKEYTVYVQ